MFILYTLLLSLSIPKKSVLLTTLDRILNFPQFVFLYSCNLSQNLY